MNKRHPIFSAAFLLAWAFLLASCVIPGGSATPALSGDEGPILTATFTLLPLTPVIPTETPTATPATFSDSLGVTPDFAAQLDSEGINSTISRSREKGNWIANQAITGWNQDGTAITEQNINIVSFEDASVHNAGYPGGILKGIDSQGKTVFWSEEGKAWVRTLEMSTDIENPTFYPWGKQYLVIETCLLNPALNKSFSQETLDNFKGWTINFAYDEKTDSSQAYLIPTDINNHPIRWVFDEAGKPVWFTTTLPDGTVYESILTQLLNPADPKNPKADETMFDLASAGIWWNTFPIADAGYREVFNSWYITGDNYSNFTGPFFKSLLPQIILAQRNGWFANHRWGSFPVRPSLDSLLSQPENSLDKLGYLGYNANYYLGQNTAIDLKYPEVIGDILRIQSALWPLFFTGK